MPTLALSTLLVNHAGAGASPFGNLLAAATGDTSALRTGVPVIVVASAVLFLAAMRLLRRSFAAVAELFQLVVTLFRVVTVTALATLLVAGAVVLLVMSVFLKR